MQIVQLMSIMNIIAMVGTIENGKPPTKSRGIIYYVAGKMMSLTWVKNDSRWTSTHLGQWRKVNLR